MSDTVNFDALVSLTRIIQSAAQANSVREQVHHILKKVSDTLHVDVCTLYQRQTNDSLKMIASHGLIQTHPVVIPPGKDSSGKC
ncbi:hypothetical protein P4S72_05590 [Vibrio sp. PP-XX7]